MEHKWLIHCHPPKKDQYPSWKNQILQHFLLLRVYLETGSASQPIFQIKVFVVLVVPALVPVHALVPVLVLVGWLVCLLVAAGAQIP